MFTISRMVLLLLLLFVIALWFLVWEWRRGARRRRLLGLLGRVREANDRFDDLVGDQRYFACRDEVLFLEAYDELRGEMQFKRNKQGAHLNDTLLVGVIAELRSLN